MIDLHTHSTISDGALTPTQLVQAAAQNGCRLLALTDHDHTGGLAEARAEAARYGIQFINGAEISVTWRHRTIHIVALDFDEHNNSLQTLLAQVRQGRIARLHQIAAKLAKHGIAGATEGALALAANPEMVSRTHIADWLVQQGHARNKQQAFTRYLGDGKSASVRHQWAELPAAIAAIQDAGGIAVIAHPMRYNLSATTPKPPPATACSPAQAAISTAPTITAAACSAYAPSYPASANPFGRTLNSHLGSLKTKNHASARLASKP